MPDVNPCPFCGDNNCLTEPYYNESYVRCQNCGACGPEGSYDDCKKMWNKTEQIKDKGINKGVSKGSNAVITIHGISSDSRLFTDESMDVLHKEIEEYANNPKPKPVELDFHTAQTTTMKTPPTVIQTIRSWFR